MNLLDQWDEAKRAPEPVAIARKSAGEQTTDLLLAREEFRLAAGQVGSGVERYQDVGLDRKVSGKVLGGVGLGAATAMSFVFPWGRSGQAAGVLARAPMAGAGRTAARNLAADAVDDALVSPGVRYTLSQWDEAVAPALRGEEEVTQGIYQMFKTKVPEAPEYEDFLKGWREAAAQVEQNGFSWSPVANRFYRMGQDVESVSGVSPGHTWSFPVEEFTPEHLMVFMTRPDRYGSGKRVMDVLAEDGSTVMGGWVDEGRVYLDVSRAYATREQALQVGGFYNELAIIDLNKPDFSDASIPVPDAYRRGGTRYNPDAPFIPGASTTVEPIPEGVWRSAARADITEEIPTAWLAQFKEHARTGPKVDDMVNKIRRDGIQEPLILNVGLNGRAVLSEGNHRLAAAQRLGIQRVPVTIITSRSVKEGAEIALKEGLGSGKLLSPSDVFARAADVFPSGRVSGLSSEQLLTLQPGQGEPFMSTILTPIRASQAFGPTTKQSAEQIFEALAARGRLEIVSAADLDTPYMREFLDSLGAQLRDSQTNVDIESFFDFTGYSQPFAETIGVRTPRLLSAKTGQTYRPLMKAIETGNYEPVLEDLATQINNVFTLLDADVFMYTFYPYVHNATMAASARNGVEPSFVSALAGVLSAGADPIRETQLIPQLFKWSNTLATKGGRLIEPDGSYPSQFINAAKAYVQLVNNPDWLSAPVTGLASKTYVYSMLRMNPKVTRALVIDRVDTTARLAAFELDPKKKLWAWKPETGSLAGVELGLGSFAERVVAGSLNLPPAAVQENIWSVWRVLRDLKKPAGGTSRQSSVRKGKQTMQDMLSKIQMPKRHQAILKKNIGELEAEVAAGGPASRYWEFAEPEALGQRILIPKTDMPMDGLLPPKMRRPEIIEPFRAALGNAARIGEGLRDKAPWAPLALTWTVAGGLFGAALGAQSPATASEEGGVTLASAPVAGVGAGGFVGGAAGAAAFAAKYARIGSAIRLLPAKIGNNVVQPFEPPMGSAINKNLGTGNGIPFISVLDLQNKQILNADSVFIGDAIDNFATRNLASVESIDGSAATAMGQRLMVPHSRRGSIPDFGELGSEYTDEVLERAFGVESLFEAKMLWNRVGNENLVSMMRNGTLPFGSPEFDAALASMRSSQAYNFSEQKAVKHLEELAKKMQTLFDEALQNSPTHPEFMWYRGVSRNSAIKMLGRDNYLALNMDPSMIIGDVISDPAYLAGSLSSNTSYFFSRGAQGEPAGVLFQVRVPADEPIVPISADIDRWGATHAGESEVLLAAGRKMRIVEVLTPAETLPYYQFLDGTPLIDDLRRYPHMRKDGLQPGPVSIEYNPSEVVRIYGSSAAMPPKGAWVIRDSQGKQVSKDFTNYVMPATVVTLELI